MICLDIDGTILNYGNHTSEIRYNASLLAMLPRRAPAVLISNQGGIVFHRANPAKYPSPEHVAWRIRNARMWLIKHGHYVERVYVSCYHPRAEDREIDLAVSALRFELSVMCIPAFVYADPGSRKPSPALILAAGATVYYGDSDEDEAAAKAAGVKFVRVERFV